MRPKTNLRKCSWCKQRKNIKEFEKTDTKEGLKFHCKQCERERIEKENSERFEKSRIWKEKNTRHHSMGNRNRDARRRGATGTIFLKEWEALKTKYEHTCLCCGRKEPEIKLELDHVIPIKIGGQNIIENAQPLCKSCNSRKHIQHIDFRIGKGE